MAWTKEPPTKEGNYWSRNPATPKVVWLEKVAAGGFIFNEVQKPAVVDVRDLDREWYGPIEPPA